MIMRTHCSENHSQGVFDTAFAVEASSLGSQLPCADSAATRPDLRIIMYLIRLVIIKLQNRLSSRMQGL